MAPASATVHGQVSHVDTKTATEQCGTQPGAAKHPYQGVPVAAAVCRP